MSESMYSTNDDMQTTTDSAPLLTPYQEDVLYISQDLHEQNSKSVQKRLEVAGEKFVRDIILSRDPQEYPDPYLHEVADIELLRRYKEHVEEITSQYDPVTQEETERCREFLYRERKRVNSQLARLTFPKPQSRGLDADLLFNIRMLSGIELKHFDVLYTLYSLPLDDLRYVSAWLQVDHSPEMSVRSSDAMLVNSIRFAKGDPTVDLSNIIKETSFDIAEQVTITDGDGKELEVVEGVDEDLIADELTDLVQEFPSFASALGVANLRRITNWAVEDVGVNGEYGGRHMNISKGFYEPADADYEVNVIAHEFFHTIQDALGCLARNTGDDWVDIDAPPSEWASLDFPELHSPHPLPDIQSRMQQVWFEFRQSGTPLREYQQKNFNELYAVAFEIYVETPDRLKEQQPEVYTIIDDIMTASLSPADTIEHEVTND